MPWGVAQTKKPDKSDVSLDDILPTATLRLELMLLVVLCTDAMKDRLNAVFEVDLGPSASGATANISTTNHDFPLLDLDDDNDSNKSTTSRSKTSSQRAPSSLQRADTAYFQHLTLSSNEIQSLKTNVVTYFNTWRTSVLRRLGETLKIRPESVKRAKAGYHAAIDAEIKARQHRDYLDWAEGRDLSSSDDTKDQKRRIVIQGWNDITFQTKLNDLDEKTRALILNATLFILLSLERYPAHSRMLLTHISRSLNLPNDILTSAEVNLAMTLEKSTDPTATPSSPPPQSQSSSRWKIGLATIAGATLIGVTGGLAAPFLLGAAGAIMGGVGLGGLATLLGATIANPVTVAALFGVLGGRMGGKAMEEFAKEVEDFEIIPVTSSPPAENEKPTGETAHTTRPKTHMRVALGVSGYLTTTWDSTTAWKVLSPAHYAPFALRYEPKAILNFSNNLESTLRNTAYSLAQSSALTLVLPVLSAALLPVGLLRLGKVLDNPFSIAMARSDKAGIVLAEVLIAKVQGERPVTLLAFSLGARVVFSCLHELSRRGEFGIVENVVLIGAPVPSDLAVWVKMRAVVSGRLVNAFTTDDLLLGYLYRVRYAQIGVAGLGPITHVAGVESIDVTGLVKGHSQYRLAVGRILKKVGLEGLDLDRVEMQGKELDQEDREERKVHEQAKADGMLDGKEDTGGRIVMVDVEADMDGTSDEQGPGQVPIQEQEHVRVDEHEQPEGTSSTSTTTTTSRRRSDKAEGGNNEAEDLMTKHASPSHAGKDQHLPKRAARNTTHEEEITHPHPSNHTHTHTHNDNDQHCSTTYTGSDDDDDEDDEDDEDDDAQIEEEPAIQIQMINLDPTPEPNPEPETTGRHQLEVNPRPATATETIRFGSPQRGFDLEWRGHEDPDANCK